MDAGVEVEGVDAAVVVGILLVELGAYLRLAPVLMECFEGV